MCYNDDTSSEELCGLLRALEESGPSGSDRLKLVLRDKHTGAERELDYSFVPSLLEWELREAVSAARDLEGLLRLVKKALGEL